MTLIGIKAINCYFAALIAIMFLSIKVLYKLPGYLRKMDFSISLFLLLLGFELGHTFGRQALLPLEPHPRPGR
jgi:hypothetical protein